MHKNQSTVTKNIGMVENILYIYCIYINQSIMTKHIISINKHNLYQYLFPSVFLMWGYFISAWITSAIYIHSKPIKVFKSVFDPHYSFKFSKIWTWIKDINIRMAENILYINIAYITKVNIS